MLVVPARTTVFPQLLASCLRRVSYDNFFWNLILDECLITTSSGIAFLDGLSSNHGPNREGKDNCLILISLLGMSSNNDPPNTKAPKKASGSAVPVPGLNNFSASETAGSAVPVPEGSKCGHLGA